MKKRVLSLSVCLVCVLFLSASCSSPGQAPASQTTDANDANHQAGDCMTLTINGMEYAFRWCPAGKFTMGSPTEEANRWGNEPQHEVTLSRGFWLLETEVTQGMWTSVMDNNPSHFKGDSLPVEEVSWNDSQEYIRKLNDLQVAPAGFKFSLPTEAQWEYACRAGTTTAYHFGDVLNQRDANFVGRETRNVGSYPANAWGLFDMHGNVWEWCQDWYADYSCGAAADPVGPPQGLTRVYRGGGCNSNHAEGCRSAYRFAYPPTIKDFNIGFRLALVSAQ